MQIKKAMMSGLIAAMVITPAFNPVFAQGADTADTATTTTTTETVKNGLQADGTYYENGVQKKGLVTIDGHNYYFDETTGVMVKSAWVGDSYYNLKGIRLEDGDHSVKGKDHYFFVNGVKVVNTWEGNAYYGDQGVRYENGVKTIKGETYYFKDGAKAVNTWYKDQFYGPEGTIMKSAYAAKGDINVYLDEDGHLATGMFAVNNAYAYFTKGVKSTATKWFTYNKKNYYLVSGNAATSFRKIGKYYYNFASNGVLKTGFATIKGKRYYFKTTGKAGVKGRALTGLFKVKGAYYYASKNGVLVTNKTLKLNGKKYTFNKTGKCTKVAAIRKLTGMDAKAQKYTSPTKYLILVNKSSHTVAIYKGSQDNWKKVRSFLCTVGKPSTPTTSGVFHIGQTKGKYVKARYFDSYPSRCWYPTRIHDGYMFHSVLYKIASKPGALNNGTLGANLSHGCIRLAINNAKYIHDVIPAGTTTVIY
ncbi:L,D-transpeptidase family protein [Intestinibaculum porci]|uniref:L,D-transpeptidase family protein n=1 Tax=Intestinibaculum porci TaxID=2487118 RepID=UPI0024095858|nr:L,D-transpeptidase [Intestinibaculum porci]MDD6348788.1 L,D-transpeptidase family protein [Intestinibaculum porci]